MSQIVSYQLPNAATILYTSILIIIITTLALYIWKHLVGKPRKPPGPWGLPIIGNLHQLGSLPHRSLGHLASIHGPLMLLKLGRIPTYVVSSPSLAKEILKTHDIAFCSRPSLTVMQKISYGGVDLGCSIYSDHLRQLRKLTVVEFFNNKRVLESMQSIREKELDSMISNIKMAAVNGEAVNLSDLFLCFSTNVTCIMAFGERFMSKGKSGKTEFDELITETLKLTGKFIVGDYFPCMKNLVNMVSGMQRRIDKNCKKLDDFLETRLKENEGSNGDDFSSVLLRLLKDGKHDGWLARDNIKAVLMNIFIGGSYTVAQTLIWTMSELIKNPRVLSKVQNEVREVIKCNGKDKFEDSDLQNLKYLNLVVKEVLRLHPPAPLLIPRESREACIINTYLVPAKSRVYINGWAIGRDPNTWKNANEFHPERFEDCSIDYKGLHFEMIPFGSGRRICPGMSMAVLMLEFTLANILYIFDWTLSNGMDINNFDLSEEFGTVVNKKEPLVLVPTLQK